MGAKKEDERGPQSIQSSLGGANSKAAKKRGVPLFILVPEVQARMYPAFGLSLLFFLLCVLKAPSSPALSTFRSLSAVNR